MGDVSTLESALRARVDGEVRFDTGSRVLAASGGSNYRQVPIGVVLPANIEDAAIAIKVCHAFDTPIFPLGADTSLAGQSTNVAVAIDFSKYCDRILEIDVEGARARVEPGVINDHLRDRARQHGLTFGPDPSTHAYCTLGGMIGNNSCGVHSVMAGRTSDNVESLEILTYDGARFRVGPTSDDEYAAIIAQNDRRAEIYRALRELRDKFADVIRARFPQIPRRVSGYNLDELLPERGFNVARALVGSEGTCVTVLEATCRLVPWPPVQSLLVLGYPDVFAAGDHVAEIMESGPIGLEGIDDVLVEDMTRKGIHPTDVRLLPSGRGFLFVQFGGNDKDESDSKARALMKTLNKRSNAPSMKLFDDPEQERTLWEVREAGLGATAVVRGRHRTHEGWEDAAVPPEKLGDYLRGFRKLLRRYGYHGALYGHFGQGCVHTRIDFDLRSAGGIAKFRRFIEDAADLVVSFGGSLSGEHGDGQSKAEFLVKMFGPEVMQAFEDFKDIWDRTNRMNPKKVVRPYRIDENLRFGTSYRPAQPSTHFQFPDDDGSFTTAATRCVGVGKCRRTEGGTMCPSFMVTRDERHTTRGRAHTLFEMLTGDVVKDGWRSDEVRDALDLCLSCKGCKADCPVNVDMATYKAEFLSHYYARRLRPRSSYALGLIPWAARLATHMPRLANATTSFDFVKRAGGIAPQRPAPQFAKKSFRAQFRPRGVGPRVLLWPDTFTNAFEPEIAHAAVDVLARAGFEVHIPPMWLCCGRPLYDYGMLTLAKRLLRRTMTALRADLEAGTPIVGLEPSCVAVFRDELLQLFPTDVDAIRLSSQVQMLSEFLGEHTDIDIGAIPRRALVHTHCHHNAVMGFDAEKQLMDRIELDHENTNAGCCGLAGSFGFEAGEHYDVSMRAGERALFPAVRAASPDTVIIADGFSCRTQIRDGTGRNALHIAQVLRDAL